MADYTSRFTGPEIDARLEAVEHKVDKKDIEMLRLKSRGAVGVVVHRCIPSGTWRPGMSYFFGGDGDRARHYPKFKVVPNQEHGDANIKDLGHYLRTLPENTPLEFTFIEDNELSRFDAKTVGDFIRAFDDEYPVQEEEFYDYLDLQPSELTTLIVEVKLPQKGWKMLKKGYDGTYDTIGREVHYTYSGHTMSPYYDARRRRGHLQGPGR